MHAWKQAREYKPGEPLYARRELQFSGVKVALGQPIPDRPELQRITLWRAGHVDHLPASPYVEAPTAVVREVSPGDSIPVRTEQQTRAQRRAQRRAE